MDTPQKITDLLNRGSLTVNELATELGISRNSVHLQVSKLEAAGTIEKFRDDNPVGVGKPAYHYRTVAGGEDAFSTAHKSILDGLIQTISAELPEKERTKLLENAGRAIANGAGLAATDDFASDVTRSIDVVNSLGALAELTQREDQTSVSCHSCPVASLVHKDPLVCRLVAAFFSEATGKEVKVECRREDTVVCGFLFK